MMKKMILVSLFAAVSATAGLWLMPLAFSNPSQDWLHGDHCSMTGEGPVLCAEGQEGLANR